MATARLKFAKPMDTRKRVQGRKRRAAAKVVKSVRAQCVERDGYCRCVGAGVCAGPSQWAHFGVGKRARTRGMTPERRHTTALSMMLCEKHHQLYDAGLMDIRAQSEQICNGLVLFYVRLT